MPKLEIRSGKAAGQVVELTSSTVTLGNRRNATVELKDPWVSFNHAKITREGDRYFIVDLRSKSGTFLNQKRVDATPAPLSPGDKILLGKTEIQFVAEAPAASASAPAAAPEGPPPGSVAAPPPELLERVATLERELAQAQKDAKNLREAHLARERLLAEANTKLRAAEARATDAEKAAEAARVEAAAAAARPAPPPPPPPPPPVEAGADPTLARYKAAYDDLRARYDDVVVKAKARIEDLTHRLEAAQKSQATPAAAAAPSGLGEQERAALVKKYEAEIKAFESALDERNKDVERLEAALEKAATQLADAPEGAAGASAVAGGGTGSADDAAVARLKDELAEKTKRVDELTRVNSDLRTQLEEINTDMLEQEEELRGEIAELERKLQEATEPGRTG